MIRMRHESVDAAVVSALDNRVTPAVAVAVFTADQVIFRAVAGVADLASGRPAGVDDWWDLASLTKTLVTLPEILALIDRGLFALDWPLRDVWPPSDEYPIGSATIGQLLSFNAGTPPLVSYFQTARGVDQVITAALAEPLARPIGSVAQYSDVGYMLLGQLVTDHTGQSLGALAKARTGLRFGPPPGLAVATEYCHWRNRLIVGEVHDENAAAMGGVAGHAGAFGTVGLVTEAAQAWLGERVVSTALHAETRRFWARAGHDKKFGLGWWLTSRPGLGGSSAGLDGYGCTGFVGNRIWLEPSRGYGLVILSNRIHPDRTNPDSFLTWCDGLFDAVGGAMRPAA
jgi:CubicO group peptidase (beta-lactamase class C family)